MSLVLHQGGLTLQAELKQYPWNGLKRTTDKPLLAQDELPRYVSMAQGQTSAVSKNADEKLGGQ